MGCSSSSQNAGARPDANKKRTGSVASVEATSPIHPPKSSRRVHQFYEFFEVLGKGGFGEVRRAVRRSDGKIVAIKTISKVTFKTEQDRKDMLLEVELMDRVRGHPNVVEMHEWFEDKTGFFVVAEIVTGGELMERIIKLSHFSEKVAAWYFKQMCTALSWCHERKVVHRDLKPENFLLASADPQAVLKLTDFGLSCGITKDTDVITDACGSAYYLAPEIFTQRYTKAVDVWSLGVILYLLLSGGVPFGATAATEAQVYKAIQREPLVLQGPAWAQISPSAKELVQGLLEKDPAKRYTLAQALAHPWVRGDSAPDAPLDKGLLNSIMTFQAANKFRKKALELVASTLSASDVATLRATFARIDKDNSGFLTYGEVQAALKESGLATSAEAVLAALKNMDSNGDGKVSWHEFLAVTAERQMINYQNNMWFAFQTYDKDGNGRISVDELREIFKDEPREKVQRWLTDYDKNGDGTIDYEEFLTMLLPKDQHYNITPNQTKARPNKV